MGGSSSTDLYLEYDNVWGKDGVQKQEYPNWWTNASTFKKSPHLERTFGFPYLSPWALANWVKGVKKLPMLDIRAKESLPPELYPLLNKVIYFSDEWAKNSKNNDTTMDTMIAFAKEAQMFLKEHENILGQYVYDNYKFYYNFFGLNIEGFPDVCKDGSPFFTEPLNYVPARFKLQVDLSLLSNIIKQMQDQQPYINWAKLHPRRKEPKLIPRNFLHWGPTLYNEIIKPNMMGLVRPPGATKPINVFNVVAQDHETFQFFYYIVHDIDNGFLSGGEMKSGYYYGDLMQFKKIVEYKFDDGSYFYFKNLPLVLPPFNIETDPHDMQDYAILTMFQLYAFLKENYPNEFGTKKLRDKLQAGDVVIKPVIDPLVPKVKEETKKNKLPEDIEIRFRQYKEAWRHTAEYVFMPGVFGTKPEWPPKKDYMAFPEAWSERLPVLLDMKNFINLYPPRRLKVPPLTWRSIVDVMSDHPEDPRADGEWRAGKEWLKVFDIQWDAYIKWVYYNVQFIVKKREVEKKLAQQKQDGKKLVMKGSLDPYGPIINREGKEVEYKTFDGKVVHLINSYPDYGIVDNSSDAELFIKKIAHLVIWTSVIEFFWGDNFWDAVFGRMNDMFNSVIDAIIELGDWVVENVVKPGIDLLKKWGPLIAAIVIVGVLGTTYAEERVKHYADR